MVTIFHTERNDLKDNESYILTELRGLSTDEKPTKIEENNIENGSVFIEIDTQGPNVTVKNISCEDISYGDTVFYNLTGDGIKGVILVK